MFELLRRALVSSIKTSTLQRRRCGIGGTTNSVRPRLSLRRHDSRNPLNNSGERDGSFYWRPFAEPDCPHELEAWQLVGLVPFLQSGVDVEFRVLDELVAEAVNDHGDGVHAANAFVKRLVCHRHFFPEALVSVW